MSAFSKLTLTLLTLLLGTGLLDAAHLSPQEALDRLRADGSMSKVAGNTQFRLAFTQNDSKSGLEAVYIFNAADDNSFIVTSADDRLPALLGYSDAGGYNSASVPPAFSWWISQYAEEAAWYIAQLEKKGNSSAPLTLQTSSASLPPQKADRTSVSALVKTVWDQTSPFNDKCPTYSGKRSVTGCVATAMAQVINYHKYPATGVGSHSYTWNSKSISFNFGATTFDWDNMINNYNNGAGTTVQRTAVATLMFACGVSVDMMYSPESSGSFGTLVPYALTKYFNFDKGVKYLERDCYTASEWDEIIYSEIAAKRPVIFGGQATGGGHEFVCDGYNNSNGFFHFNWGWGGYYDGYFILSDLNPEGQGTGGYDGGYNSQQHAICNIKRPEGSNQVSDYTIGTSGGLQATDTSLGNTTTISFSADGYIANLAPEEINLPVLAKFVSASGEVTYGSAASLRFPSTQITPEGYLSFSIRRSFSLLVPSSLAAGKYKMSLAYQTSDGEKHDVPMLAAYNAYLNATVGSDRSVTFTPGIPKEANDIEVTELYADGDVMPGEEAKMVISIKNKSASKAYDNYIYIHVYEKGSDESLGHIDLSVTVEPLKTVSGTFRVTFDLDEGNYEMKCFDAAENLVSPTFPLKIGNPTDPVATGITLDFTEKTLTVGEEFTLTATVTPDNAEDKTVTWSTSDQSVATVDADGRVKAEAAGTATITATTVNGLQASCALTVNAPTIPDTGVSLDKTSLELTVGEEYTLTATIEPDDSTDKSLTWTTSDESVATVDANGLVKAIAPGTANIRVITANNHKARCTVKVNPVEIPDTSVSLDETSKELTVGEEYTLTATIEPDDSTDKTLTWSSSDESVATVDANGLVKAIAAGTATITVTTKNQHTATCVVTVKDPIVLATSISLDKTSLTLSPDDEVQLTATVLPENTTDKTVAWESTDTEVATVDQTGKVTVLSEGSCIIIAKTTDGSDLQAECSLESKNVGIESIIGISTDRADIFTLSGILLKRNADKEYIRTLLPGLYIVRTPETSRKVVKR